MEMPKIKHTSQHRHQSAGPSRVLVRTLGVHFPANECTIAFIDALIEV